jgi:signal peptidase I
MSVSKTEKTQSSKTAGKRKDRVAEVVNTCEWLITAFILAFVFRAFVMEAFRIPTGSMADTLKGAHFQLRCHQCGYQYEHGFVPRNYGLDDDTIPAVAVRVPPTRCPNCGYFWPHDYARGAKMRVANGDRILVLKCFYQFFEPRRWDVIVFKNPLDPTVNYIKRLVGLPDEKLATIDGDVYIDGQIARKPPKVQGELWMPVYNNDYQPVRPRQGSFNGHAWEQPFRNEPGSQWITADPNRPTTFCLKSPPEQVNTLAYDTSIGNDFRATYAYDEVTGYRYLPQCSDLMIRFYAQSAQPQGQIGAELSKYETRYRAWIDLSGDMVIAKTFEGQESLLARKRIKPSVIDKVTLVKFANVDHQLIFQVGEEKLTYDLGLGPDDAGPRKTLLFSLRLRYQRDLDQGVVSQDLRQEFEENGTELSEQATLAVQHPGDSWLIADQWKRYSISREETRLNVYVPPQAKILGAGEMILSHIALFRDIHYTETDGPNWASEDNPITLGKDEFFVLGDNSPNSEDGRRWNEEGIGIDGQRVYRKGIVPRDYLVGKALFVYWPSGFRPFASFPFAAIPNVGQMRFIYGGSGRRSYVANAEP